MPSPPSRQAQGRTSGNNNESRSPGKLQLVGQALDGHASPNRHSNDPRGGLDTFESLNAPGVTTDLFQLPEIIEGPSQRYVWQMMRHPVDLEACLSLVGVKNEATTVLHLNMAGFEEFARCLRHSEGGGPEMVHLERANGHQIFKEINHHQVLSEVFDAVGSFLPTSAWRKQMKHHEAGMAGHLKNATLMPGVLLEDRTRQ